MNDYQELANSVVVNKKNRLDRSDASLTVIGKGRSAIVFKLHESDLAMKVFFPEFEHIAKTEAEIYEQLQDVHYFPTVYESGKNYVVMNHIEGLTLFECLKQGRSVTPRHIEEIDRALALASEKGLNPSDIHLRNIFITPGDEIKLIDVARYRQTKECEQWSDLKKAYHQFYGKRFFPSGIPAPLLNTAAFLYKKGLIPFY